MEGIKETKEALLFGISLAMAIDESTQDGFQWTDILNLIPTLSKFPAALANIEKVPAELNDLDETERLELAQEIEKLDFKSDSSEKIAEQSLRITLEIGKLITIIRENRL